MLDFVDFVVILLWAFVLIATGFFSIPISELFTARHWRNLGVIKELVMTKVGLDMGKQEFRPPYLPKDPNTIVQSSSKPSLNQLVQDDSDDEVLDTVQEKRSNILQEILSTEETYVENLTILVDRYLKPIRSKELLSGSQIQSIFSNAETLQQLNSMFLRDLKTSMKSGEKDVKMAEVLSKFAQGFKLYTTYISSYVKGVDVLKVERQEKNNAKFAQFLTEVSKTLTEEKCRIFDLGSYLILPIQRLPRYRMLLEDLLKNTNKSDNAYAKLVEATDAIRDVTTYLNSKQHEHGNMLRIIELNEILGLKNLIQPNRHFIKECDNCKKIESGSSKAKSVALYLFSDMVVYLNGRNRLSLSKNIGKEIPFRFRQPNRESWNLLVHPKHIF
jgi:hypothetical protein